MGEHLWLRGPRKRKVIFLWKVRIKSRTNSYVHDAYVGRVSEGAEYRYFGPSGAPDMVAYTAQRFYKCDIVSRYERPRSVDPAALLKLAEEGAEQGDGTKQTYMVPNVVSSK